MPEILTTEVCIIGGGSGGIGAALAAARAGARVTVVERNESLGGASTMGWVSNWEPMVGGGGLPRELWARMAALPNAVPPLEYRRGEPRRSGESLPYEPGALAIAAATLLDEAPGPPLVLFGATLADVDARDGALRAALVVSRGRRLRVEAPVFIDCTGDGSLCALAGCEVMLGADPGRAFGEPSAPQEPALRFNGLTHMYRIRDTGREQPPPPRPTLERPCPYPAARYPMPNGDLMINAVDMLNADVLSVLDSGRVRRLSEQLVLDHFAQLVEREGLASWALVGMAPEIGVRESRRIVGEYVLREQDCLAGMRAQDHPDPIAITDHSIDVHGAHGGLRELPNGAYGVPFRCLLPEATTNLLVACRAASFSQIAASSCRLQRAMITLGQAAGNAAAMAVGDRAPLRALDVSALQAALRSQGVELPT